MTKKITGTKKHDRSMRTGAPVAKAGLVWRTPMEKPFRLAGFAWFDEDRLYRRMPAKAREKLPESVEWLCRHTSGGQIRFQTDSRRLALRVTLRGVAYMDHMTPAGTCGFDCYVGAPTKQRHASTTRFDFHKPSYEHELFNLPELRMRNITLNFPLYMGVKEVLVGLERGARVKAPPAYASNGRVVVYGTSVTQGGCATRPGMSWTNILSRRLNVEVVNLGFSGSGRGEPEVARTIAGLNRVALFILDYEANTVSTEALARTLPEFLDILRAKHPTTPILVVSRLAFTRDLFVESWRRVGIKGRAIQKRTVAARRAGGDRNVHFLDGSTLLGRDFDECTVDDIHQTDLGFLRIADAITPTIKKLLRRRNG